MRREHVIVLGVTAALVAFVLVTSVVDLRRMRLWVRFGGLDERSIWETSSAFQPSGRNSYSAYNETYGVIVYNTGRAPRNSADIQHSADDALFQAKVEYSRAWRNGEVTWIDEGGTCVPFRPMWLCVIVGTLDDSGGDVEPVGFVVSASEVFGSDRGEAEMTAKCWSSASCEKGAILRAGPYGIVDMIIKCHQQNLEAGPGKGGRDQELPEAVSAPWPGNR